MAMTEEEMMYAEQEAQAQAEAEAEQNSALEAEINARGPKNTSGSPDDRQVASDAYKDTQYQSGIEGVPHNTMMEAKAIGKGVANAGIGALQTAHAVGTTIGASLGRGYDKLAPSVGLSPRDPATIQSARDQGNKTQKMFQDATFQPETAADKFYMPAAQIGATIAAGGGAAGAIKEVAAPVIGKVGGYVAGALGGATVAASTMPEQEGMIVRHDGWMGFPINPDDDATTQQTKKTANQVIENMVLGVAGDGAYALGKKGVEVVKNVLKSFTGHGNVAGMKQQAAEDIASVFAQLGEHPTAEQEQAAGQTIIDLIDKNGEKTYGFGEGVGDKTVKRDTVSAITAGLDDSNPVDRAIATRMEALRASAKRGQAPKTAVQLQEPQRVLNQGMQDAQEVRGGAAAIDQTKQNLQQRAVQQAEQADVPVQRAKDDLVAESSDYTSALKNDSTFGPSVKEAEAGGVKLDIHAKERELKGQVVTKAGAAQETDKALRDSAYKAVSDSGAPAKMDEFMSVYEQHKGGIPANIQKLVEKADGTFGYLNNEVRPRISEALDTAYKTNNGEAITALKALKKNIQNDQMAYLTESSNDATAQLAQKANKANQEYSAKWNDSIGEELRVNKNNNRFAPNRLQEQGRAKVDAVISDPNRKESVDSLKKILGPDEGLVPDIALAKTTRDLGTGKADIEKVTSDLQTMANSFGPKQKARIEGFLTDLKSKKMTIEDLKVRIPQLEKDAAIEKEEIFSSRFPDLFETVAGKKAPKGNGYEVFQKALDAEQPRVIDALIAEAKKTPGDIEGIQTAWLKSAESKLNPEITNRKFIGDLDEKFVENGKKIFGEDSPEVKSITGLRNEIAKLEQSLNKPGQGGLSGTENQSKLRSAISLVQTFVFGVLNPTAARINKITSNLAESYSSVDASHEAIDSVLADNQEMRKAMVAMVAKSKNRLSPAAWKQLYAAGARMGLYALRDQTQLNFDNSNTKTTASDQTKKALDFSLKTSSAGPEGDFKGLKSKGNIDLTKRPKVKNSDGSVSTVKSMSYENDAGEEVLIPTVSDEGKMMTNREAMEYWGKKKQWLGKFDNPEDADAYAEALHKAQEKYYKVGQ